MENRIVGKEKGMKFSIIVVALNPGEKLEKTLNSIFSQTCTDYEIILKDGGSRDGSMEAWRASERVEFFCEPDKGIYDAMNQAVSHASGEYLLFLNCGDLFADNRVLEKTADFLKQQECDVAVPGKVEKIGILYGDTIGEKNGVIIAAPPKMTGFTCYRNIPCHQACFYRQDLCKRKPYEQKYRIRADYDHFLWCFFEEKVTIRYMGFPVASYEGGGYSESQGNRKRDREEHREITARYIPKLQLYWYRFLMGLTLAPVRRFLAENKKFSGLYHKLKCVLYGRKE